MGAYTKYNKISNLRFKKIVYCFACNIATTDASKKLNVSIRTVNDVYLRIRKKIAKHSLDKIKYLSIDPSEYYFGFKKNLGLVFVVLKTNESKIVVKTLDDNEIKTLACMFDIKQDLMAEINKTKEKILNNEKLISYYGLVDLKYKICTFNTMKKINYQARKDNVVQLRNEVFLQSFFIYARKRLAQIKGISNQTFDLHLRTAEFLFNRSVTAAYQEILAALKL